MQAYDSIVSGYFCIGFIDFILKGKSLLEYTNLFSQIEFENNSKKIRKYFQLIVKSKIYAIVLFVVNIQNLKTLKYLIFYNKH